VRIGGVHRNLNGGSSTESTKTSGQCHQFIENKNELHGYSLATMFAQEGMSALISTSVVYLSTEVGLNAMDTSLFSVVVLIGTLPVGKLALRLSKVVAHARSIAEIIK
jgi:MFS-type transporter involved in bile tolerance (Atg22 family)